MRNQETWQSFGCPRTSRRVCVRHVDGDVIAYQLDTNEVLHLNASAGRVLELCDGAHTPAQIANAVAEACGIEAEIAWDCTTSTLHTLAAYGVIEAAH